MKKDLSVGNVFSTNGGGDCVIIQYSNFDNILVEFLDVSKYRVKVRGSDLRKGKVKNLFYPSVCGIGYLGDGEFKSRVYNKKTEAYRCWCSMLARCYAPLKCKSKNAYKGCTVHEDWHNFQVFAKWYYNNKFKGQGYHLDKDILVKGNKLYSEKTCCLVPREINSLLLDNKASRGDYLQGVTFVEKNGSFLAQLRKYSKPFYIGCYQTEVLAAEAYKREKEAHVKAVALEWKDKIDEKVFITLMNWTFKEGFADVSK